MTADDQTPASLRVAQVARLRDALDAAADGPVDEGWAAIAARAATAEPVPTAPRRTGRWLAVAAALVVVASGVALATRDTATPTSRADVDGAWCAVLDRPARSDLGIVVFVEPDATDEAIEAVRTVLTGSALVGEVTYVDRDASYAETLRLFEDQPTMLEVLEPEDVPTSFRTSVTDTAARSALDEELAGLPAVLESEVEPAALRSVFARLVLLARNGYPSATVSRPIDPDVVDALVSTAPTELTDAVAALVPVLRAGPTLETEPSPDAAAVVADAEDRCGLSVDAAFEPGPSDRASTTTTPTATTGPVEPAPTGAEATGWVVPVGLPAGWTVTSITVGVGSVVADCGVDVPVSGVQWVDAQGRSVTVTLERCVDEAPRVDGVEGIETAEVDLGSGVTATSPSGDVDQFLAWETADGVITASGRDVDAPTLASVARHVVDAGGITADAPAGWDVLDRWEARPTWPAVQVEMISPGGTRVMYTASPPGTASGRGFLLRRPTAAVPGGLPSASVRQGDTWWAVRSVGIAPSVDVSVMVLVPVETRPADEAATQQLVDALRPVDVEAWRAFLSAVPGDLGALLTADAPADLADVDPSDLPTPSMPGPDDPPPTTTTQPG